MIVYPGYFQAGSERIVKSKVEGMREKEAVGINQSLSVLGRVIKVGVSEPMSRMHQTAKAVT